MAYWLRQLQKNFCAEFFPPYVGCLLAAAVFKSRTRWTLANRGDVLAGISIGWLFVTAAVFALNINDHARYLMALFPYVAILVCWTLAKFRPGKLWGGFAVLCALQFSLVLAQAYGFVSPLEQFGGYLVPWERSAEGLQKAYFAVDQTCDPDSITAVGVELPGFNAQAMSFYAAIRHPEKPCIYFGLPAHETELAPEVVWATLNRQRFRYYLYQTFSDAGDYEWLNKFSRPVLANVKESPSMRARPDKTSADVLVFEFHRQLLPDDKVVVGVGPEGDLPFGFVDEPPPASVFGQEIPIFGWTIGGTQSIDACLTEIGGRKPMECRSVSPIEFGRPRPDVAKGYPNLPDSLKSGFQGALDVRGFPKGRYQMAVVVHARNGSARQIASIPIYLQPFIQD
jgi:hypothetical protein